jgi:phage terminase large subunit-like protein
MPHKPAKPIVDRYIADVLSGKIVTGRLHRLCVERHVRDLKDGKKRGLYFDEEEAERVIEFFGFLRLFEGEWAGQPFTLQPWQVFKNWVLFGWKNRDGTRRFRIAYASMARKDGKSTDAAAIGCYMFVADREPGAQVFTAATKRQQAGIIHRIAQKMVETSPSLRDRVDIVKWNMSIAATDSKYEPLAADAKTEDGHNPHCMIIDELHAHPTRAMWDVLDSGTSARRQPLMYAITTAGYDRTSICYEQDQYAIGVLEQSFEDDTFFAFICRIDEKDDWKDESCWIKSNPNLGISVKIENLRRRAEKAKRVPAAQNDFLCKNLNVWVEQQVRAIDMDVWDKGGGTIDVTTLAGKDCIGALDLGKTRDLTSLCLLFRQEDLTYDALWWFWCPRENAAKREMTASAKYMTWAAQGYIELTDGNETDYEFVRRRINEIGEEYLMREVAIDRLFQGADLSQRLGDDGFEVVSFGQGFFSMAAPTEEFERVVYGGMFRHGDNPVARWMASNAVWKMDPAGNRKPDKAASQEKIDGVVTAIMALGRWMLVGEPGCPIEERGLLRV